MRNNCKERIKNEFISPKEGTHSLVLQSRTFTACAGAYICSYHYILNCFCVKPRTFDLALLNNVVPFIPAGPASSRRRTHRSGKMVRLLSVPRPDNPAGEFYLSAVSQEAFQTSCNRCFLHSVCGGNVGI